MIYEPDFTVIRRTAFLIHRPTRTEIRGRAVFARGGRSTQKELTRQVNYYPCLDEIFTKSVCMQG